MYGFEKGIAYLIIGAVILFNSKWIYQNAVSPNGFKNKVIMAVVGIAIVMFIILDFADFIE
tara:strand:- start:164 stop:346 length:183 start_codon:yes stop_codon:yes gene_type:complete